MALAVVQLAELTQAERNACTEYGADATLLHACTQGYGNDFDDSAKMQGFIGRAAELVRQLDSAIQKFELTKQGNVYSGHGRGFSVVGCFTGEPRQLIGLRYSYPGYISASWDRGTAEHFLRTTVPLPSPRG